MCGLGHYSPSPFLSETSTPHTPPCPLPRRWAFVIEGHLPPTYSLRPRGTNREGPWPTQPHFPHWDPRAPASLTIAKKRLLLNPEEGTSIFWLHLLLPTLCPRSRAGKGEGSQGHSAAPPGRAGHVTCSLIPSAKQAQGPSSWRGSGD